MHFPIVTPMKLRQLNRPTPTIPCWPKAMRPDIAALYLGLKAFTIEELLRDGTLPYKVVGGSRVILQADLDEYIETIPRQNGRLPGRGRWKSDEKAA
jgi:excisionase family DNA binding protein